MTQVALVRCEGSALFEAIVKFSFSARVERLLEAIPEHRKATPREMGLSASEALPAVHAEWTARGETGFRIWLRDQPISTTRAAIGAHDLDPIRRNAKWKEREKLADFVADSIRARLAREATLIRPDVERAK